MKTINYFKISFLFMLSLFILSNCKEDVKERKESVTIKENKLVEVKEEKIPQQQQQQLTQDEQIASAILAAPKELRDGAKVYGFDANGKFMTLREGKNEMICIADNPTKDGFEVVAYHKDLEPYMERGRILKAEGKSAQEKSAIREKEAVSGKLIMPKKVATLHILFGNNGYFDVESGLVKNAHYRYVVYMPFATQVSTGLSLQPNSPGHPWLMFPGKSNAHIMISPPVIK